MKDRPCKHESNVFQKRGFSATWVPDNHLAQLCLVQYLAKAYGGRYLDGIGGAERVSSHENNSVLDDIFVYTHQQI